MSDETLATLGRIVQNVADENNISYQAASERLIRELYRGYRGNLRANLGTTANTGVSSGVLAGAGDQRANQSDVERIKDEYDLGVGDDVEDVSTTKPITQRTNTDEDLPDVSAGILGGE